MTKTTNRSKLYVVRVWNEPGDEWRASAEDPNDHSRAGFTSPEALTEFLATAGMTSANDAASVVPSGDLSTHASAPPETTSSVPRS